MSRLALRPPLVFDIETCPLAECAEYVTEPIEAPSNYKDPVKIAAYIEEKRKEQIAKAALDVDLCQIVAVGTATGDNGAVYAVTLAEATEVEMLTAFWAQAEARPLVGFNCLAFDLPVLLRRSLYLDIPTPRVTLQRYQNEWVTDVSDVLSNYGRLKWRSLAFYCKRFGIDFDASVTGEDIGRLVTEEQWATIQGHVRNDVEATRELALRIGALKATPQPAEEQVA